MLGLAQGSTIGRLRDVLPFACTLSAAAGLAAAFARSGAAFVAIGCADHVLTVLSTAACASERGPVQGAPRRTSPAERALVRAHAACMVALIASASSSPVMLLLATVHAALLASCSRRLMQADRPAGPAVPAVCTSAAWAPGKLQPRGAVGSARDPR